MNIDRHRLKSFQVELNRRWQFCFSKKEQHKIIFAPNRKTKIFIYLKASILLKNKRI